MHVCEVGIQFCCDLCSLVDRLVVAGVVCGFLFRMCGVPMSFEYEYMSFEAALVHAHTYILNIRKRIVYGVVNRRQVRSKIGSIAASYASREGRTVPVSFALMPWW